MDDIELLLYRADLELLLEKDGCLLVVVANNLVDDELPVATHVAVEEAAIVQRLVPVKGLHKWADSIVDPLRHGVEFCGGRRQPGANGCRLGIVDWGHAERRLAGERA